MLQEMPVMSSGGGGGLKMKVYTDSSGTSTAQRTNNFSDFTKINAIIINILQNSSARIGLIADAYLDDNDTYQYASGSTLITVDNVTGNTVKWTYTYGTNYNMEFIVVGE